MESESFQTFFDKSTRLVERALNQPYDFAVDYSGGDNQAGYMLFRIRAALMCLAGVFSLLLMFGTGFMFHLRMFT